MKTTHWLVTAAAVAVVGVIAYTRLSVGDPPLPKVPLTAEADPADTPRLALPPVVLPPEETLAIADVPPAPAVPPPPTGAETIPPPSVALASATEPAAPPTPIPLVPAVPVISGMEPVMPSVPTVPAPVPPPVTADRVSDPPVVPIRKPEMPTTPVTLGPSIPPLSPPVAPAPVASVPTVPAVPLLPPPPTPAVPPPAPVVQTPAPVKPDAAPLPPASEKPPEAPAAGKRYVVLKDNKLIEGDVSLEGDTVFVQQGSIRRKFPKGDVQFVAGSKDEVHRFMVSKESATDAAARLKVARWCMFSGMREQALAEAREVVKLRPNGIEGAKAHNAAVDLARSLELSLQQFPTEAAAKMAAPAAPTFPVELAPARPVSPAPLDLEPDVSPEAALVFGARVQPFLANQCVECHGRPDYAGKFKLVRVTPADAGPQATRANLKAVAGQLRKDDPVASPLLWKTLTAHGGMKLPAVMNRQAVVYQSLEAWTALAVGTPLAVPPAPTPAPAAPVLPVTDVLPPPPALAPPLDPQMSLPAPAAPLPVPPPPIIPPVSKPVPVAPPFIPPADAGMKPVLVPVPAPIPPAVPLPIPPAAVAPLSPSPVVPVGGTQFGATILPQPPATGPTGADEFDPTGFNRQPK